jgi:phosphohistidine phosphatase
MQLLVIRHAIAEDQDAWRRAGGEESDRPLTEEGRARMAKGARGLREVVPEIGLLVSSPYARATQTAHIIAKAYGIDEVEQLDALIPEASLTHTASWLRACDGNVEVAAIVGHEPHLSRLVTWLICGSRDSRIELKKGAACLLSFDRRVGGGTATLVWLLTPKQLRRMAREA